jgi:hypothetical protein
MAWWTGNLECGILDLFLYEFEAFDKRNNNTLA